MWVKKLQVWFYALICTFAIPVHATTLLYQSFDDIVTNSDGIVTGTVTDIQSVRMDDGDIFTYVTIDNLQVLDGDYSQNSITLQLAGGFVESEGIHIHGSPQFDSEEQVIVFLEGNGQYIVPIIGWNQGLFKIEKDTPNGRIVTDGLGNRVFGIENGHLQKSNNVPSQANIINQPILIHKGQAAEAGAGIDDNGNPGQLMRAAPTQGVPMTEGAFIAEIKKALAKSKKKTRKIKTVAVGQPLQSARHDALNNRPIEREFESVDTGKPELPRKSQNNEQNGQ